jgi:hypothetical protein
LEDFVRVALMTKSLDPFRFLLIAVSGWMNLQQQLQLIDYLERDQDFAQISFCTVRELW